MNISSHVRALPLEGSRVLLRADLNVPLGNDESILDDHRLRALLPTIELIHKKGGKIILATHIDRPKAYTPTLSTQLLIPWFTNHGYAIDFEADLGIAYEKSFVEQKTILLLDNLRFFPGEEIADTEFAQQLAQLGDYYINDAFATIHRNHASITITPTFFPAEKRTIGLLIEKELRMLEKLIKSPKKPFVVIIGGAKVADKIPLLKSLLPKVTAILLGPAIVFTFLKALGKPVGTSLVDDAALDLCSALLEEAKKRGVSVLFPRDYQVSAHKFEGPLSIVAEDNIPNDMVGISIGPETAERYRQEIIRAKTVFLNGLMGDTRYPKTLRGTEQLFQAMADSEGFTVIGGGDSVGAAHLLGCTEDISYISTGGGATLTYITGKPVPGLAPFVEE